MTDRQFHEQLLNLTDQLARAASARPYDPDAYNAVIYKLNKLCAMPIDRRRRLNWFPILIVLLWLLALAILLYSIVCPL